MRGIILAGGTGQRLRPLTTGVNKHLLPVHDKPMIFYPLSTLISMGVRDVLLVTDPTYREGFERLIGDGKHLGISVQYAVQDSPSGVAGALMAARGFVEADLTTLVLGDNVFHGIGMKDLLSAGFEESKATIFSRSVPNGSSYGVVYTDRTGKPTRLVEKPKPPGPAEAVPGLYVYPSDVLDLVETLSPSARGELEISDLNQLYLNVSRLALRRLHKNVQWFDAGTLADLTAASRFVRELQEDTHCLVGSPEISAWCRGFIDDADLQKLADWHGSSSYGHFLSHALKAGWT
ncbi:MULTISPECIES: sugar nucleotidyltransferase [Auritidibacter]|uniref:Glucose-1-phosphate thymidylyltransferase n=1 Tax=Auritidibacter ignavus TaxID=678932 RepID=A0AAJ6AHZ3_9MICC|nr:MULTISPECIES: sugar phosphate nucleotidyltransferase [Auritidibacter]WGH84462.1 sugar phosphate nucleotidyltransferase [Auritidibacter ignavus]WGH93786.1 sugar phosphate nucleotidyltransferase [Auritidibacter ignavus]WHS27397.1 sugar phosphate nucleotidyltransferase [Auritidibacter ignavus]